MRIEKKSGSNHPFIWQREEVKRKKKGLFPEGFLFLVKESIDTTHLNLKSSE
jgi:hypothetical protein